MATDCSKFKAKYWRKKGSLVLPIKTYKLILKFYFNKKIFMKNIAHFCSWGWSTMAYAAEKANNWELWDIRSGLVIVSKGNIWAIEEAKKLWIDWRLLQNPSNTQEILQILEEYDINIASWNGYLKKFPADLIKKFEEKWGLFLNQHPWILRADHIDFWWEKMYGPRVTASRIIDIIDRDLEWDDVFTESVVQYVAPEYDQGSAVSIVKLIFADEMEEFRAKIWILSKDLDRINYHNQNEQIVQEIIKFTKHIQTLLLEVEHKNVAWVFQRLWNWESPLKIDTQYNDSLWLDKKNLEKAKKRAIALFPKG